MKLLLLLLLLLFVYITFNYKEGLWVEDYDMINNDLLNIYGEPLKPCRNNSNDMNGSWDKNGFCSEEGGGVHQICFKINDKTKDFSVKTKQSNWSEKRLDNNHCMCLGAYALYKAKQDNNDIPSTNNELLCESIPEVSLSEEYISKWSKWNGHEYDNQIVNGVNALYEQCYNKANTKQKKFLKNKYNNLMRKIIN